ncbi:MAG TPA: twin-arginine translocation signal domain-containing protein [Caldithrix abyssi]|uniref:Twin-arginine translocation signal domain-containing protein n=1 Tax=Caldithrix abyssi TaxID=187145 RepID=A0A7V4WUC3_CALAY|nr:twin-arginine translocation signal domain-containing protein [Caldithrix abyssi]
MSKLNQLDIDMGQRLPGLTGVSRRDFLKFCAATAATLGLPLSMTDLIAKTIENAKRPPVIWLHFQECTGCTESLLRATHPTVEHLILDLISLDYSETLMAGAGHQVEEALHQSVEANAGKFILVCEGSVPTADGGVYCKIAGKTALDILNEIAPKAAAIVAIGSCASWGGVQSADPNPTGAKGINEIITDKPVINLPGCPASPYNLLSTVLYYLTLKKLPELDKKGRPKFAYGRLVHENCERRPHFDAGRFANEFGDYGHKQGWCLYKLGCKGPETHANCPIQLYGDVGSNAWPVGTGHPCFGCTEKGVGFTKPIFQQAEVYTATPPALYPDVNQSKGNGLGAGAAAIVGAAAGAAVASGIKFSKVLKESEQDATDSDAKEE